MNYDFNSFHKDCGNVEVINSPQGLIVYCPKCRVLANIEAVSGKVSPADACKINPTQRQVIGKQSANVNCGGYAE